MIGSKSWLVFACALAFALPLTAETLVGKQVRFDLTFPDVNSVVVSSTHTVVDPGVEVNCASPLATGPGCGVNINQGAYSIDFQPNRIVFTTSSSISSRFGSAPCNCYRFTLLNPGQLYFSRATISGNIAGTLTFNDTSLTVDLGGVAAPGQGQFIISFELAERGPFTVVPSALNFEGISKGMIPIKFLAVGDTAIGRDYTVSISQAGLQWLRVGRPSTTPSMLAVEADPGALDAGRYTGTITISSPPTTLTVPVTFDVKPAAPAKLVVTPDEFVLISLGRGNDPNSGNSFKALSNEGSGTIGPLKVSAVSTPGLQVVAELSPPGCTVGRTVTFSVCYLNVDAKSTTARAGAGRVLIQNASDGRVLKDLPMTINSNAGSFGVLPRAFFIGALADPTTGPLPPRLPLLTLLTLFDSRGVPTPFSGRTLVPWLTFTSPTTPTGGVTIQPTVTSGDFVNQTTTTVNASAASLAPGGYYGGVRFDRIGANAATSNVQAVMEVVPATGATRSALPLQIRYGIANPYLVKGTNENASITIGILDAAERPITLTDNYMGGPAFFTHTASSATGSFYAPPTVEVRLTTSVPGVYTGALVVEVGGRTESIPVLGIVPSVSGTPNSAVRSATACVPTRIVPLLATPLPNFNVRTAWPTELNVTVADDCGKYDNTLVVSASFSNGDPTQFLTPVGDGKWTGVWVGERPSDNVVVTVTAISKDGKLRESTIAGGAVSTNPTVPLVSTGGAVNGASFVSGPLSPGSFVSIFGAGLADSQLKALSVPLPLTLAGASVQIGGVDAPVFFVSDGQLNAIVPYGLPVDEQLPVVVKRGGALSVQQSVLIAPAAPGIFQYGDQLGIIVGINTNGSQPLADASNPVAAGQTIVAYATGLGEVSPAVPAGSPTPAILAKTTNAVTMTIDGKDARVDFAGLTPGSTGLYQVNAVVPAGVTPGSRVPVILTAAGQSSAPVYIAVK